MILLQKHVK